MNIHNAQIFCMHLSMVVLEGRKPRDNAPVQKHLPCNLLRYHTFDIVILVTAMRDASP